MSSLSAADIEESGDHEEAKTNQCRIVVGEGCRWPAVGRVDNVYGDCHLICTCLPLEEFG